MEEYYIGKTRWVSYRESGVDTVQWLRFTIIKLYGPEDDERRLESRDYKAVYMEGAKGVETSSVVSPKLRMIGPATVLSSVTALASAEVETTA
jgi:hypothetical protein